MVEKDEASEGESAATELEDKKVIVTSGEKKNLITKNRA